MAPPTFTNTGRVTFDWAVTGMTDGGSQEAVPFLDGSSESTPYIRETSDLNKQQVAVSDEPGEKQLGAWWYRSQSDFSFGEGVTWGDAGADRSLSRRFNDSCGVDVFDTGKVSLLRKASKITSSGTDGATGLKPYTYPYTLLDDDGAVSQQGVIYVASNFTGGSLGSGGNAVAANSARMWRVPDGGTPIEYTLSFTQPIFDVVTDGSRWYALADDGIYTSLINVSGSTGTKLYDIDESGDGNLKRGRIALIKDRIFAAISVDSDSSVYGKMYSLPMAAIASPLPTTLETGYVGEVNMNGWRFTGVADGPTAVYYAGYAGDTGRIYATTIKSTTNATAAPTSTWAYVVAELPKGEIVTSFITYMGTYAVIGTNKGVRIAVINPEGSLTVGPLSVETDTPVWGITANGDSVYFGGSKHSERAAGSGGAYTDRIGIYRLYLGVDGQDPRNQLGIYPVARHIYAAGTAYSGSNQVLRVANIGITGRLAFTADNVGLFMESASERVETGWIRTGRFRYDTQEAKHFVSLRATNDIASGTLEAHASTPDVGETLLGSWAGGSVTYNNMDFPWSTGKDWTQLVFVLSRGSTTATPVFTGYTMRALPATVSQRNLRCVFLCFPREKTRDGVNVERDTWQRIRYVENMEKNGGVARLQNLRTGENVLGVIDKVQFVSENTQSVRDTATPGGVLMVTFRTI